MGFCSKVNQLYKIGLRGHSLMTRSTVGRRSPVIFDMELFQQVNGGRVANGVSKVTLIPRVPGSNPGKGKKFSLLPSLGDGFVLP